MEEYKSGNPILLDPIKIIDGYLDKSDWRVKENSTSQFSLGGLNGYITSTISANYWLNKLYPEEIAKGHKSCDYHIHDLQLLSGYCFGWSIKDFLEEGLNGVRNRVSSKPPKHLNSALSQIINIMGIFSNEAAGAQAFNNFDTHLSAFIKKDNLSDAEIKQALQNYCFDINTEFVLSDGETLSFKEAKEKNITSTEVLSFDGQNIVSKKADNIGFRKSNAECLEIILEDGTTIIGDLDQKLLIKNKGWIKLKDLTESMEIDEKCIDFQKK